MDPGPAAAQVRGEAMRMGELLHNGFVGWLLLATSGCGPTDTTRRARARAAVGAGARELTCSYYRGRGQRACGGLRLRVKRTSKDRLGERTSPAPGQIRPSWRVTVPLGVTAG